MPNATAVDVNIKANVTYPATPQVTLATRPTSIAVYTRHPTALVYVSFDGTNDAGIIDPAVIAGMDWDESFFEVYLHVDADPGVPVDVVVSSSGSYA